MTTPVTSAGSGPESRYRPDSPGRVVITHIRDEEATTAVVVFICRHAAKATTDTVRLRISNLPAVIVRSIPAAQGERLAGALRQLGADAVFIGEGSATIEASVASVARDEVPGPAPSSGRTDGAPSPSRPPGSNGLTRARSKSRDDSHPPCTLLAYALLASLVAVASPVFYICALPLALFAAHKGCGYLRTTIFRRALMLLGVFLPLGSLAVLFLLLLLVTVALRREKKASPDSELPEGSRNDLRLSFAFVMLLVMIASYSNILPVKASSLVESVETLLQKEAARVKKEFPKVVNKDLRIEGVTAGPEVFTYNCTLIRYPAENVDAAYLRETLELPIRKQVCSSEQMQRFLKKDAAIAYMFNGNDGLPVTTITIKESDCGN